MNTKGKVLFSFFLIAVFISFLGPIVDPDFPFHLKTGEYIYQHREIPQNDPFSFYDKGVATDREKLILSQYWLAQVIFYKLYSIAGPPGVIFLRATIFSLFIFFLWVTLKDRGLYSSLIITILVTVVLQQCKLDRPQFFSFLFMLILMFLIEKFRENPDTKTPLYFVPLLVLLWANMHGGFVFGIAVLLIYALSETLKLFIGKPDLIGQHMERKSGFMLLFIILLSILFSYINPITNNQMLATFESHTEARWLYKGIREYMSPVEEMKSPFAVGFSLVSFISFWILFGYISVITVLNAVRTKSMDITVFALILFSSIAAFTAVRYIPFFIAIAILLTKNYRFFREVNFLNRLRESVITYALFLALFISGIVYGFSDYTNMFKILKHSIYPEDAANFLLANRIDANMFNQANRGSYLLWRLYPHYRVFIDTRNINENVTIDGAIISSAVEHYGQLPKSSLASALSSIVPEQLGKIDFSLNEYQNFHKNRKPLWAKRLEEYNIDLIVHEATADFTKNLYPLTLRLLKDDEWVLIYIDGTMQIFVRNKEKYFDIIRKFRKPKEYIYDEIILEVEPFVKMKVPESGAYSSLGFAYMMKGDYKKARIMIDAALELDKNNLVAHFCNAYLVLVQKNSDNTKKVSYDTKRLAE